MGSIFSFAATGFEYQSDEHTLGLWHFNEGSGNAVKDASKNKIKTVIQIAIFKKIKLKNY